MYGTVRAVMLCYVHLLGKVSGGLLWDAIHKFQSVGSSKIRTCNETRRNIRRIIRNYHAGVIGIVIIGILLLLACKFMVILLMVIFILLIC